MALAVVREWCLFADHGLRLRRATFGTRMGTVVNRGQVLEVQMSVNLRGGDVGMAEQLLHGAQVLR